jgi:hypothetical protein
VTKFFIPGNSPARSEEIYQWLVTYVNAVLLDCQIDPIRIFSLAYRHEDKQFRATVGDVDTRTGQLVIAILRADTYLICTPYYGVQRGEPIPVSLSEADEVRYFEGLGNALEELNLAVKALDSDTSIRSRLRFAGLALERVGIDDFPATMVPDFMSLNYKLTWRGDRQSTLDRMTDAEGEGAAAAIRALYVHVLADWTRTRGGYTT